ncbi:putative hexuronate utilization operon transcriptional repressor ExuR [Candidatus Erwinia dacicola]|uniref:Hexuronate utilization operon transcriptional repressor ExuR n=1 Tax=Candidatus Erwinia dacicola TaxID=252393 RepID=A0A328TRH2_9GAMM|nr:putative hexuronate utilization operon transcriptional repressor ExuR [Candidatus Erwinia dacicola]
MQLIDIQAQARKEDRFRDSEWDMKFHVHDCALHPEQRAGRDREKDVAAPPLHPLLAEAA